MGDATAFSIMDGLKLLLCRNGDSAADAQHLAAELLVRLRPNYNRADLPAISLSLDTSTITACGNSPNFINDMKLAKEMKIKILVFLVLEAVR
jgi:D-sedoheptulose 7-phosphate isomerase